MASTSTMFPSSSFPNGVKTEILAKNSKLIRVHGSTRGPIWFGPGPGEPPGSRFDAPNGEYRTLYAAEHLEGAFVETMFRIKTTGRIISRARLMLHSCTEIRTRRDLVLAKLYNEGLLWHETDASISTSDTYDTSRAIALKIWQDPANVDGIMYRSRHDNGEICYALFDRVVAADLEIEATDPFADHMAAIEDMVARYGGIIDNSGPIPPP